MTILQFTVLNKVVPLLRVYHKL